MALNKQFDLELAATRLPTKKLSGRQRKVPGALTIDDTDFVFEEDGVETTEFIAGRIKSSKLQNGIYKWRVKFDDGDELFYECEEVAEIIVASRRIGLDVTSLNEPSVAEGEKETT
ncbi:hypothetical protein V7S43_017914 [Phytophthora oleae]|uniref:Uncharacterized protein n=1 Tax=Phytophthora oleae TaxID=2107226 RepID=A0ABD3ESV1_9STRA